MIIFFGLWSKLNGFLHALGIGLVFIHLFSFFGVLIKDPGIPPKDLWLENYKGNPNMGDLRICNKCKVVMKKEEKIEHCNICNICIVGKLL